jgi:hypothetical protein
MDELRLDGNAAAGVLGGGRLEGEDLPEGACGGYGRADRIGVAMATR